MKYCSVLPYNADIKIAGNVITFKTYEKTQIHNYICSLPLSKEKSAIQIIKETYTDWILGLKNIKYAKQMYFKYEILGQVIENKKKERFYKSCYRAKQNIFDLIACNTGKHVDIEGKRQTTKFLTLTFKENITDISKANLELTKFFKRLSYMSYGVKKNVIKYIAVPELQKRGVWHFHIILFNMKYIPFQNLLQCWKNGGVYINALKSGMDGTEVAKYITKYISKYLRIDSKAENLESYFIYKKYGMQNKKRYYISRGLTKPIKRKIEVDNCQESFLYEYLVTKAKIKNESEKSVYYKEYDNEYRGNIRILTVELNKKDIKGFKDYIDIIYKYDINRYSKITSIKWDKLNNIRNKMKKEMYWYSMEDILEKEYIEYNAIIS